MADWATNNGLELNLNECKAMILSSEAYITTSELIIHYLPSILINDIPIQNVKLIKNLGIWLTSTLNWTSNVNYILKKVYLSLGRHNFYRRALSISLKEQFVLSLFISNFDYASVVFIDLDKTPTYPCRNSCRWFCENFYKKRCTNFACRKKCRNSCKKYNVV